MIKLSQLDRGQF